MPRTGPEAVRGTSRAEPGADLVLDGLPIGEGPILPHGALSAFSMAAFKSGPARLKPRIRVMAITISSSERAPFSRYAILAAAQISSGESISAFCSVRGAALRSRTGGSAA
jgi:hypothetical protein